MADYITLLATLFSFLTLAFGVSIIWQIRGGFFAKAFMPLVAAWLIGAIISLFELLDTTPRGMLYSNIMRLIRITLSFLGAFFLWRILHHSTVKMRIR